MALVQDCIDSIANALKLLQSCTNPLGWSSVNEIPMNCKKVSLYLSDPQIIN